LNIILQIIVSLALITNCSSSQSQDKQKVISELPIANERGIKYAHQMVFKVDSTNVFLSQKAVDHGHQPWQLDPIDVACSSLPDSVREKVEIDSCELVTVSNSEALVECHSGWAFKMRLRRIARIDSTGIWTPIELFWK
jgi:hypothetical protein